MHVSSVCFSGERVSPAQSAQVVEPEPREWQRVLGHLGEWLSPRELLNTLCAAVAAELSLSTVALLRRGEDGALSRIASAEAAVSTAPDSACWTFPDRGATDVLVFAGDRSRTSNEQWNHWARRMAAVVLRTARPFEAGDGAGSSRIADAGGRVAAIDWRRPGVERSARFAASEAGIVDHQKEDADFLIRMSLEGLDALEPLGDAGWRRLLGFSVARLVAIAGDDRVAELDDGDYVIRLPRDPSQAIPMLDAMYRALLSPVPGVGRLPALEVRVSSV